MSDREIAGLISISPNKMDEIKDLLLEVAGKTDDKSLKVEIEKYLARQEEKLKNFKRSYPGTIYVIEHDEEHFDNVNDGYTSDYDKAYEIGIKMLNDLRNDEKTKLLFDIASNLVKGEGTVSSLFEAIHLYYVAK